MLRQWGMGRLGSARLMLATLVIATLVLLALFTRERPLALPITIEKHAKGRGRLHLLIPVTSTNRDFCALLLSAQILGYPTPILINYGDAEDPDPYKQHMAKVQGILNHLNGMGNSTKSEEDMILVVDGYDVWFQLPPEVLIKRYYEVARAADQVVIDTYGRAAFTDNNSRNTVLFGPDKICWPIDYSRPACWAVPPTTLPEFAFGPDTRTGREEFNDPRWLNSGTIMAPLQDMRDMFNATLEWINTRYTVDSDQFYFAELFGEQEYARLTQKPEHLEKIKRVPHADDSRDPNATLVRQEPSLHGQRTEYHIFIDGASALFQTLAFWKQYLTWMRPADAWSELPYSFNLPEDLARASLPYHNLGGIHTHARGWADVVLLYNVISGFAPVLLHFTGEKRFRDVWWKRIWWQSDAKLLREAAQEALAGGVTVLSPDEIDGRTWYAAVSADAQSLGAGIGAVMDRGGLLTWTKLCGEFESSLYAIPDDEFFHPPPKPTELPVQTTTTPTIAPARGTDFDPAV